MKWLLIAVALYGHEGGMASVDTREMELTTKIYTTEAACLSEKIKIMDAQHTDKRAVNCVKL